MSAEDGVRRTLALYAQCADNRDPAGWSRLFTPDGHFVTPPDDFAGRPALQAYLEELISGWVRSGRRTKHFWSNAIIRVDGDTAQVRSGVVVYEGFGDGPWQIAGVNEYADRMVKHGDEWLFAERRFARS
jgi:hypothetical protein